MRSDELVFKPPRTWAGWARDVAPTVGLSALAVGTTAYSAMSLGDNIRNTAAKNAVLNKPLAGRIVQPLDGADECMRLPHVPRYKPRSIDHRMAVQAMAMRAMPQPQNTFQRGVLKAQDAAVDAAAAAGAGAVIGAIFGGPIGLVAGILAGGAIGAIGGEMRGR